MKKVFASILLLFCLSFSVNAGCDENVPMKYVPKGETNGGGTKSPENLLYIDLEGHTLFLSPISCDYVFSLYDGNGLLVYSTIVVVGTTQIALPSTLSGTFELCLEADTHYFYGFINL